MKIYIWRRRSFTVMLHTIMGMQVGIELDTMDRWISISLLLIKITITTDPWIDPLPL